MNDLGAMQVPGAATEGETLAEKAIREYEAKRASRGKRTVVNGYVFDSEDEAKRYGNLLVWQGSGVITDLAVHPTLRIMDGFDHQSLGHIRARNWKGDFQYRQLHEPGLLVFEDFKGRDGEAWKALLAYRLYFIKLHYPDLHVFVNHALRGWYRPFRRG